MVRDFSHRNVKISHRTKIGANFSHCKVTKISPCGNFHCAGTGLRYIVYAGTLLDDLPYGEIF
jgi:hypothetical protein